MVAGSEARGDDSLCRPEKSVSRYAVCGGVKGGALFGGWWTEDKGGVDGGTAMAAMKVEVRW